MIFFILLESNLGGQLEGNDQTEMIEQIIGKTAYKVKTTELVSYSENILWCVRGQAFNL